MQIGIGLPNPVPAVPGHRLLDWARRAEERGFSGLATIDRLVYPGHDSLAVLAAVAGATSRIALLTNILIAPLHPAVALAKAAASIDSLSGGRLTLGMSAGGRADDYAAVGRDFHTRGREFDAALETMHRIWRGEPLEDGGQAVGPRPLHGDRVPVLIGGRAEAAMRRVARWGDGWTMGGGAAADAQALVHRVRAAWLEAGRDGEPRLAALAYFSLGEEVADGSRAYLLDYYGNLGEVANRLSDRALRSERAVRDAVKAFEDVGVTELYFDPTVASLDQVDRLADEVL